MIHDVEHLQPELNTEILRNSLDLVVLEYREVEIPDTGTNQNIAARVAAQVEAAQISGREETTQGRRSGIAVGIKKGLAGSNRNTEALRLNIARGVARICSGAATRTTEPVWKREIVAAECPRRITAGAPRWSERNAVADGEDHAEFPPIRQPSSRAGEGFGSWNIPGPI